MQTADVAIVGGGVIGCSIAYHLTCAGVTNVVLLERARLAAGATGVCPGGVRQQFEGEAECRMAKRSLAFFHTINETLEPESPFFFERSGYLFLAESQALLERFRKNVALQNGLGIPSQLLSPEEIGKLLPALRLDGVLGGAHCAGDGFLEDCDGMTNALARRARDRGAKVLFEDVQSLHFSKGTWVLQTNHGVLQAGRLVLAAGADAVPLAAGVGLRLPIVPERRRLAFTEPLPSKILLPLVVSLERGVAGKQLMNGVFYIGWLSEMPEADDLTFIEKTMEAGATLLPELAQLPVRRVLAGAYDTTPDHRPILGAVSGWDGLYLAVGFSGHGFMVSPVVGELLAGCLAGQAPDPLLASFSLDRFAGPTRDEGLQI